ncbi:MAG: cytochrome c-type biogenesis protein CcmH [Nitrospirae bacterium]|nr:cytochrome c-type biogenesis protein CcmH [Candidatus Manganitrophaceae bacterium]
MIKYWILIPVLLILFSSFSTAQTLTDDQLQVRVKEVAKTLRCAVCQSESVWESNAELAIQMRDIIRERLVQGQSPDEIRAYFVSRYGDFILLQPRTFVGMNWLLWGGPFLLLILGGTFLFRTLRKWVAQTAPPPPEDLSPLDERSRKRVEQALRSFESDK